MGEFVKSFRLALGFVAAAPPAAACLLLLLLQLLFLLSSFCCATQEGKQFHISRQGIMQVRDDMNNCSCKKIRSPAWHSLRSAAPCRYIILRMQLVLTTVSWRTFMWADDDDDDDLSYRLSPAPHVGCSLVFFGCEFSLISCRRCDRKHVAELALYQVQWNRSLYLGSVQNRVWSNFRPHNRTVWGLIFCIFFLQAWVLDLALLQQSICEDLFMFCTWRYRSEISSWMFSHMTACFVCCLWLLQAFSFSGTQRSPTSWDWCVHCRHLDRPFL
jgi:hypothetical protein